METRTEFGESEQLSAWFAAATPSPDTAIELWRQNPHLPCRLVSGIIFEVVLADRRLVELAYDVLHQYQQPLGPAVAFANLSSAAVLIPRGTGVRWNDLMATSHWPGRIALLGKAVRRTGAATRAYGPNEAVKRPRDLHASASQGRPPNRTARPSLLPKPSDVSMTARRDSVLRGGVPAGRDRGANDQLRGADQRVRVFPCSAFPVGGTRASCWFRVFWVHHGCTTAGCPASHTLPRRRSRRGRGCRRVRVGYGVAHSSSRIEWMTESRQAPRTWT